MKPPLPNLLARALRDFFAQHLPQLRGVSPHTIASYRDSIVLLLRFIASHRSRSVACLDLQDLDTASIIAFLDHLEQERGNTASTRNVRLAAIHSFARYLAAEHPERLEQAQRILSIPFKRSRPPLVEYLEYEEVQALLDSVDRSTQDGERDYVLLATLFNTGARVQEILNLRPVDLQLVSPFQARLFGKGRKERFCPLWPQTAEALRAFCMSKHVDLGSTASLFRNHRGQPLSRFGVRYILAKYHRRAKTTAPTLDSKKVHPHTMRHSTAVHLLKAGVDLVTISHWLGHSSPNTTNRYAAVDLEMKREALQKATPPQGPESPAAWRHDPSILEWLESL